MHAFMHVPDLPEVTGTDEALALVSPGSGLWVTHLAGAWTEPSHLHYQTCYDLQSVADRDGESRKQIQSETCQKRGPYGKLAEWREMRRVRGQWRDIRRSDICAKKKKQKFFIPSSWQIITTFTSVWYP